jgi:hypothetical protein
MRKPATYSWLHIPWVKPRLWPPTSDIYTAPILVDAHIASRHAWKARIRLAGGGTDGGILILHGTSMKSEYTAQTTSVGIAAKGSAVF